MDKCIEKERRIVATIEQLSDRWYVSISGAVRPFTNEAGFDTPRAAADWAVKFAEVCATAVTIRYADSAGDPL
jgi:hypothetical protein